MEIGVEGGLWYIKSYIYISIFPSPPWAPPWLRCRHRSLCVSVFVCVCGGGWVDGVGLGVVGSLGRWVGGWWWVVVSGDMFLPYDKT